MQQQHQALRAHLTCFQERVARSPGALQEMRALFARVAPEQRREYAVHWSGESAMTLVAFSAMRGRARTDYVPHEFLLKRRRAPELALARKKTRRDDQIRLEPWPGAPQAQTLHASAFTTHCPLGAGGASGGRHYEARAVSTATHKLTFALHEVRAKLDGVEGTVSLGAGEHDFVASNCTLRMCARDQFRGLTLRTADQAPLALDYDALARDGVVELALQTLVGVDRLCRVTTRSPLSLVFETPGSLLLARAPRVQFDLRAARSLEYWSEEAPLQPRRFVIEGCALLDRLACLVESGGSPLRSLEAAEADEVRACRMPRDGFRDAMARVALLRGMKVLFVKPVPYFFIDGEAQLLTLRDDCFTLLYRQHALASFTLDDDGGTLRLRLIYAEDSVRADPLYYYIY